MYSLEQIAYILEDFEEGTTEFTDKLIELLDKKFKHHQYNEDGLWVYDTQAIEWTCAEAEVRKILRKRKGNL